MSLHNRSKYVASRAIISEGLLMEQIISPRYQRINGKDAWRQNLRTAVYAADKLRSTLGPKGAYKMVTYNKGPEQVIKVTKDAIAVLDELAIQHPPAVIIAESAKMQRQEAGDGTATFVIFLSALLKKADLLMNMKIHPNTIVHGYHMATEKVFGILVKQTTKAKDDFDVLETIDCKRNLLTPKIRLAIHEAYPLAFVDGRFDLENIRFLRKSGSEIDESALIYGVVVKKSKAHPNMPDSLKQLRIALTSERLGFDRLELKMKGEGPIPIRVNIKSAQQMQEYRQTEVKLKTDFIKKLTELQVNVLLCQQPIEEYQKRLLLQNGIFALERVDQDDLKAIAYASGAKVVSNLKDLTEEDVGNATELESGKIELENITTFRGCRGATFLLRGNIPQVIDELETAIKNGFIAMKNFNDDNRVVVGAGAVEAELARQLQDYARSFDDREQIVIEAYASALLDVPRCLAENYGLNPTDAILELRRRHSEGNLNAGISEAGVDGCVCMEPLKVKQSVLRRACEVSQLMLKIDELIISKEIPKFHKK